MTYTGTGDCANAGTEKGDLCFSGEGGTLLGSVIAHRDHELEDDVVLVQKSADEFALLSGDIDL